MMNIKILLVAGALWLGSLLLTKPLAAQQGELPLDSLHWDLSKARLTRVDGTLCAAGSLTLNNTQAVDFTAEWEMYVTGERSYPGILFRKQNELEFERIYLRPHLPPVFQNVVQHVSTFNGIDSWQLYKGASHTASLAIPQKKWFHLKLVVSGNTANLFVDQKLVLEVDNLLHGSKPGEIELDAGTSQGVWFSHFKISGISVQPVKDREKRQPPPGIVQKWEVSQSMKLTDYELDQYPLSNQDQHIQWNQAFCRDDGIIDVSRTNPFIGNTPNVVIACASIGSDEDQNRLYSFGYSDLISVFLNGKLLFMGNSSYTSRDPNFQGIVGLNDYLNLPLKKGNNELLVLVAETFGGWGFVFQEAKAVIQHQKITKQWEVAKGWRYPETVVYDEKRDCLYVSNFYNDGAEYISKAATNGEVLKMDWATGVAQPTGMVMSNNKLYVVCRYAIVEIDPDKGVVTNRFRFAEPGMPNGITTDTIGNLFITDTRRNCIYKLAHGVVKEWLCSEDLGRPNGILFYNGKLLVGGSGDAKLKEIDTATRTIKTLVALEPGSEIDGIRPDGRGGVLFSDYNGRLFRLGNDQKPELLLDTRVPQQFCAAFEYISSKELLIVPTLFDNKIVAYKYKY